MKWQQPVEIKSFHRIANPVAQKQASREALAVAIAQAFLQFSRREVSDVHPGELYPYMNAVGSLTSETAPDHSGIRHATFALSVLMNKPDPHYSGPAALWLENHELEIARCMKFALKVVEFLGPNPVHAKENPANKLLRNSKQAAT